MYVGINNAFGAATSDQRVLEPHYGGIVLLAFCSDPPIATHPLHRVPKYLRRKYLVESSSQVASFVISKANEHHKKSQ